MDENRKLKSHLKQAISSKAQITFKTSNYHETINTGENSQSGKNHLAI
jgi:hypothetical protein